MQNSPSPKIIYLLMSAEKQLQQWMKHNRPKDFPSPAQSGVLFLLGQNDGLLMGEIAQRLHLVPSAVSGLIQRMENEQWLSKQICTEDARASRVYLLPKAKQLLPKLIQHTQQLNQQLLQDMSPHEIQAVERWLNRVIHQFPSPSNTGK